MVRHTSKHIRFDWAIKKLLLSKANFGILEGFLSELLKEDIKIQEILESEGNRERSDDKTNRVDIMVKNYKGELMIIEIQNTREIDYFLKILYNTSKAITEHIDMGSPYTDVKKVITVSVVYFDLGSGRDYIYHGTTSFKGIHHHDNLELDEDQKKLFVRETVSAIFPDHYIIRVNGFDDVAKDSLDEWVYFLKNSEIKDNFKARGLEEAREKLKEINLQGPERDEYMGYLKTLHEDASRALTIKVEKKFAHEAGLEEGLEKGLEQGRKEGEKKGKQIGIKEGKQIGLQEGKEEVARNALAAGLPIETVVQVTGLSKEKVRRLKEGL